MKRCVLEAWEQYETLFLGSSVSSVQRKETRRAFYAGAFLVLDSITSTLSDGLGCTDADEQFLRDLELERGEYVEDLKRGRL